MRQKPSTAEELMKKFANKHSYETWDELMHDTHGPIQIMYTAQVMRIFARIHSQAQQRAILEKVDVSCPRYSFPFLCSIKKQSILSAYSSKNID